MDMEHTGLGQCSLIEGDISVGRRRGGSPAQADDTRSVKMCYGFQGAAVDAV